MKETDNIINLCTELEKEADRLGKEIEILTKSLSIAAGMIYDLRGICPQGHFPLSDIIVQKICTRGEACAGPLEKSIECWGKYLRERTIFELEKNGY